LGRRCDRRPPRKAFFPKRREQLAPPWKHCRQGKGFGAGSEALFLGRSRRRCSSEGLDTSRCAPHDPTRAGSAP
jgi:hypothetical protein